MECSRPPAEPETHGVSLVFFFSCHRLYKPTATFPCLTAGLRWVWFPPNMEEVFPPNMEETRHCSRTLLVCSDAADCGCVRMQTHSQAASISRMSMLSEVWRLSDVSLLLMSHPICLGLFFYCCCSVVADSKFTLATAVLWLATWLCLSLPFKT